MTSWLDLAGWTLVHFVWQGAAIALAAAAVLRLLTFASPQARYAVACSALALMLAAPAFTALVLSGTPNTPLIESVHLLRSEEGAVVGVAIVSTLPASSGSLSALTPPRELRLPFTLDTDALFSSLVTLWLCGVVILLLRLAAGCWRIRRLHLAARLEQESRWQPLADDIASRLGLRRRFSVVDSVRVATPTVIGWLRPIVLLPVAAFAGLTPRQVEAILAHELAHIRRHDFAINILQTLAETVLFYHPAVWWMSARIRTEREHCCDDVAVGISGDATEYAAALTELAAWSLSHTPLAMAATRGPLLSRVRRLLRLPESDRRPGRTLAVAVVLLCVVVGMLGAILKAQPLGRVDGQRGFGPPQVNRLLGFNLFPGPVQLPGEDPIGARAWKVIVGGTGAEVTFLGFTARSVIRQAYEVENTPIVGGPRWMDDETFDLTAPADLAMEDGRPDEDQTRAALRQMLEGQLGLTTHLETRAFPAYALVTTRTDGRLGPSLKPSTIDCFAGGPNPRPNANAPIVGPVLRERRQTRRFCGIEDNFFGLTGVNVTIAELASEFHRRSYPLSPDREVVDRTGLSGRYDFELRFGALPIAAIGYANYRIGRLLEPFGIRSVFTALPEQLGLNLVDTTISREVLVIDQINRP